MNAATAENLFGWLFSHQRTLPVQGLSHSKSLARRLDVHPGMRATIGARFTLGRSHKSMQCGTSMEVAAMMSKWISSETIISGSVSVWRAPLASLSIGSWLSGLIDNQDVGSQRCRGRDGLFAKRSQGDQQVPK